MAQLIMLLLKENRMFLEKLKEKNPLIICITNNVVKNFTANGLLAIGAAPAMSESLVDLRGLVPVANALLINIGTFSDENISLFESATAVANKHQIPVIFDPVAAGASKVRLDLSKEILKNREISVLRGNASEIAAILGEEQSSKGPDGSYNGSISELALKANHELGIPIVISGKEDAIACQGKVVQLANGSPLMSLVTGTGCLLGAFLAAFIGIAEKDQYFECMIESLSLYNIAGELAEQESYVKGPASFQEAFIDHLYTINVNDLITYQNLLEEN